MTPTPTRPEPTTPNVLSHEKIEECREFTRYGAHLGIGGKFLASILDSHEALRAALLAASTGARGAVVEEIAKRHEDGDRLLNEGARAGEEGTTGYYSAHADRAILLALIGAKQP